MKCSHCGKNEASSRFFVSYNGYAGEVSLCGECLEKLRDHAFEMIGGIPGNLPAGFPDWNSLIAETRADARTAGNDSFPADVGEDIRRRRMLAELGARLDAAVKREDYETAARLRDEIYYMEKGVRV